MAAQPISQRISYSQAASTTTANILSSTNLNYVGLATVLQMWAAAYLASAKDTFSLTYSRGSEYVTLVPPGTALNVNAAGPQQLNDLVGQWPVPAGANLVLAVVSDATSSTHTGAFALVLQS